jgi:predicted nucleic acid-binding Zn ribbon protein
MNPRLRQQLFRDWVGTSYDHRSFENANLSSVFQRAFQKIGLKDRFQETTLSSDWGNLVGPTLCSHCQPGQIRQGVLTVRVDHSAWLHQINMVHKADILQAVQKQYPFLKIQEIQLRIGMR